MRKLILLLCFLIFNSIAVADEWNAEDYFHHSSSQREAASDLMKFVPLKGNERVLDVGCGDGKITASLAKQLPNGSILGLDLSSSMITYAKNHFTSLDYPNLHFVIQDAGTLLYNQEFDLIVSFTTLQWVQDHPNFLKRAYESLKPQGTLALTMPMGLPPKLEQAVQEIIAQPQWAFYFHHFSTGWNFTTKAKFAQQLEDQLFKSERLAIVPQCDIFPSREAFEKFISQWFPYLRPLPEELKPVLMKQVVDRFLELEEPFANREVHFRIKRLEVVVKKP